MNDNRPTKTRRIAKGPPSLTALPTPPDMRVLKAERGRRTLIPLHRPPLQLSIHRFHALHIHHRSNARLEHQPHHVRLFANSLNVSSMSSGRIRRRTAFCMSGRSLSLSGHHSSLPTCHAVRSDRRRRGCGSAGQCVTHSATKKPTKFNRRWRISRFMQSAEL